jgi:D-alanyl-lipoteichoic acid acyltransferase DltB (MBOAT superfamily)
MIFNSLDFFVFLSVVFVAYWLFSKWYKAQNLLIVIASYIFYAFWDWRFLLIIGSLSAITFICGICIERISSTKNKLVICIANVIICLLMLGIFKYFNFFADSFGLICNAMGIKVDRIVSHLILPIGISFYSFKCISYIVDVYKKDYRASADIIAFFAYICFFPQLMAGPIDRASSLLTQFQKKRSFNEPIASDGCRQMLWGFFKKAVVADNCQVAVDQIWGGQFSEPGYVLILVSILYSFQIYCDFSGYSDLAIGCGKLFGIKLTRNFNNPYFSRNIQDFWRRWHISLMTWLRDYIYIPLGGSRCTSIKIYRNIVIVWAISGLWHGANWTFVCWGLFHAFLLISYRKFKSVISLGDSKTARLLCMFVTFLMVSFGWILFRAESVAISFVYLNSVFVNNLDFGNFIGHLEGLNLTVIIPAIGFTLVVEWLNRYRQHGLDFPIGGVMLKHTPLRYSFYVALVLCTMALSPSNSE